MSDNLVFVGGISDFVKYYFIRFIRIGKTFSPCDKFTASVLFSGTYFADINETHQMCGLSTLSACASTLFNQSLTNAENNSGCSHDKL